METYNEQIDTIQWRIQGGSLDLDEPPSPNPMHPETNVMK